MGFIYALQSINTKPHDHTCNQVQVQEGSEVKDPYSDRAKYHGHSTKINSGSGQIVMTF